MGRRRGPAKGRQCPNCGQYLSQSGSQGCQCGGPGKAGEFSRRRAERAREATRRARRPWED